LQKTCSFAGMNQCNFRLISASRRILLFLAVFVVSTFLFSSCKPTKRLGKDEYLLTRNTINYHFPKGESELEQIIIPREIDKSQVSPYLRQKPNTKIFGLIPFRLYVYNMSDTVKSNIHKAKRNAKFIAKAAKKGWKDDKLKRKLGRNTGREWLMNQGEAPVKFDSSQMESSAEQIRKFLFNKGYFNARVKDSVHFRGKKAEVSFSLFPGNPYKINKIDYTFEDSTLKWRVLADTAGCLIKNGVTYDQDNLYAEGARITKNLNNSGYYYFSKGYVGYLLDTNSKTHTVDVTFTINKSVKLDPKNPTAQISSSHRWMQIRNITVEMQYDQSNAAYHAEDTVIYNGIKYVAPKGEMALKPSILAGKIFLINHDTYRIDNVDNTYTGLSQLKAFRYISIKFAEVKDSNMLDCYIQLLPFVKHSVGSELDLTYTGGDDGIQGDVSYLNNNQFKGAEQLQFKITGGFVAQKLLTSNTGQINPYIPLNTIDLGPELDLSVPRPLFPLRSSWFKPRVNPQTSLKLAYNFQQRPDYSRHILSLSYSFDYNSVPNQHFTIVPFEWSYVNANLSAEFSKLLQSYNNLFLENTFKNQAITDGRVTYTSNTQSSGKSQFDYLKLEGELSGLVLFALKGPLGLKKDAAGDYDITSDIPYSQYIKGDIEWRHYFILDKSNRIVIRELVGGGLPYDNSQELPFTKSFWAGGSNDIRAWQLQTLGPGGINSSDLLGQVGDIKLEFNQEYRVSLIRFFGLGIFLDEGNIWLIKNKANEGIPLAYFQSVGKNNFLSEMAVGAGLGFRFDFTYFVFRVDLSNPLRDPSLEPGHRLIPFDRYSIKRTVLNIGIGYPF